MHLRDAIDDDDVDAPEERAHIAGCAACRAYYDERRLLLRALAGDLTRPTRAEDDALTARVLAAAAAAVAQTGTPAAITRRPSLRARARSTPVLGAAGALLAAAAFLVTAEPAPPPSSPALASAAPPRALSEQAARVTHAQGAHARGVELVDGAVIRAGDRVRVAEDGVLEASLERGGTLRAFPGATFSLDARGESVALGSGKVWCIVDPGKGRFLVRTADAVVRVTGTSFFVDADVDGTEVRVVSGSVEVDDDAGRGAVKLAANEGTHVSPGALPQAARRIDTASDISEWQRFFEMILRKITEGMKSLGDRMHFR